METGKPLISQERIAAFQQDLLAWYQEYKRDLPWRKDQDPYKVWVSEIMLQQTKVATVIPYFERFINKFPTLTDLANADEQEVLKQWEGLGYYSRARNLHQAVQEVRDEYGSKVPDQPEKIGKLRGIGPYTKGAILSIAFDQKQPAVDGNVMRVFSRWFELYQDIALPRTRVLMEQYAIEVIPEEKPGDFNQALMELGATICTPTSPSCLLCPVQHVCQANQEGVQEELPVKKKSKAPKVTDVLFLAIHAKGEILLEKRPDTGLLASLWSLPTLEISSNQDVDELIQEYCQGFPSSFTIKGEIAKFEHIFSHRHWKIKVIEVGLSDRPSLLANSYQFCSHQSLQQIAFANVYAKAIQQIEANTGLLLVP